MPIAIIYENFADKGQVTGPGFLESHPATMVQDTDIGLVARTESAAEEDMVIEFDLGAARPVGGLAFGPLNAGPGASFHIEGFSDAAMTDLVYDPGVIVLPGATTNWADTSDWLPWEDPNFWFGIKENEWPELPSYAVHAVPAEDAALAFTRYWRVSFSDPGNTSGFLSIGRALIGRVYRPSHNYSYSGNETGFMPLTDVSESLGGSRSYFHRGMRRRFRCAWDALPEAEAFTDWYRIAIRSRIDQHLFVIPDEADLLSYQRRALLATMTALPPIQQALFQRAAITFDCEEVL